MLVTGPRARMQTGQLDSSVFRTGGTAEKMRVKYLGHDAVLRHAGKVCQDLGNIIRYLFKMGISHAYGLFQHIATGLIEWHFPLLVGKILPSYPLYHFQSFTRLYAW